jgi:heme ABC exporter ATP-binding subunit CcmA
MMSQHTTSNDDSLAIRTRELTKEYGHRAVLRRINLDVARGESIVLRGANGAGKTTLLRCLAGIVRPSAGKMWWFGKPAIGTLALRHWIGMAAHDSGLYPQLTLRENLLFAARLYGLSQPHARVDELLEQTSLTAHGGRWPGEASRGMRQRVALARAWLHEPPLLLLDEPTTGLDVAGRRWLDGQLRRQRDNGCTLCVATHEEDFANRVADRVYELRDGRLEVQSVAALPAA